MLAALVRVGEDDAMVAGGGVEVTLEADVDSCLRSLGFAVGVGVVDVGTSRIVAGAVVSAVTGSPEIPLVVGAPDDDPGNPSKLPTDAAPAPLPRLLDPPRLPVNLPSDDIIPVVTQPPDVEGLPLWLLVALLLPRCDAFPPVPIPVPKA